MIAVNDSTPYIPRFEILEQRQAKVEIARAFERCENFQDRPSGATNERGDLIARAPRPAMWWTC